MLIIPDKIPANSLPPISAADARKETLKEIDLKINLEEKLKIKIIFSKIHEKIKEGKFELFLDEVLPTSIKEHFVNYGYVITEFYDDDKTNILQTKISW